MIMMTDLQNDSDNTHHFNKEGEENTLLSQLEISVLLKQWEVCTQLADSISSRRDAMNKLFTTLCLGIVTITPIIESISIPILLVGIILSITWWLMIDYYRGLNKAKYRVIAEIESDLPFNPIEKEWSMFKSENNKMLEGTIIEKVIPATFFILFLSTLIYTVCLLK